MGNPMRNLSIIIVALLALAMSFGARAEPMEFSYLFYGKGNEQPWARTAVLTVTFDGTVQADFDTVTINSISSAVLTRPGLPDYTFAPIEPGDIQTFPPDGTPVVSFSGSTLNFNVCPNGFKIDTGGTPAADSCDYKTDSGFGMFFPATNAMGDIAFAADDTVPTNCPSNPGCPVTDDPMDIIWWELDSDSDGDGVLDTQDTCPDVFNEFQLDSDGDGAGDACEIGDTQTFGDTTRPIPATAFNDIPTSCVINGWLVFDCDNAIIEGEDGAGDNALRFDPANANKSHFNFLTWEQYPHADGRFLGDYLDAEVTALRFRARHGGGSEDLVLRVMVADSFDDGGADFAISTNSVTIPVGSGWTDYEISLDKADLVTGTRLFGDPGPGPSRRTVDDILGNVAQFSLRHDPTGAGPGTPAPTDSVLEIDDIELEGSGSTGPALLLLLIVAAYRRSRMAEQATAD